MYSNIVYTNRALHDRGLSHTHLNAHTNAAVVHTVHADVHTVHADVHTMHAVVHTVHAVVHGIHRHQQK